MKSTLLNLPMEPNGSPILKSVGSGTSAGPGEPLEMLLMNEATFDGWMEVGGKVISLKGEDTLGSI